MEDGSDRDRDVTWAASGGDGSLSGRVLARAWQVTRRLGSGVCGPISSPNPTTARHVSPASRENVTCPNPANGRFRPVELSAGNAWELLQVRGQPASREVNTRLLQHVSSQSRGPVTLPGEAGSWTGNRQGPRTIPSSLYRVSIQSTSLQDDQPHWNW